MARQSKEELPDMGDDGEAITRRRERLGLPKNELAEAAGIHRNTLAAIENGESGHRSKLALVLAALDQLELEAGIDAPPPPGGAELHGGSGIVIIRLKNDAGEVVLEGPREDRAALIADAQRLLDYMRKQDDE